MAKNFDYILQLANEAPSFIRLHKYCDKAECLQKSDPEDSTCNARKALEWLVKSHLAMASVDTHDSLANLLESSQMISFIGFDTRFQDDIYTVKKIGNRGAHPQEYDVKPSQAYVCLRALFYVVEGFLIRWRQIEHRHLFDATLIPESSTGMHIVDNTEPTVEPDIINSVPSDVIEHPQAPTEQPKESLASEAITRKYLIDYMLNEAGWDILDVKGDIQGGKACIEVQVDGMPTPTGNGYADYVLFSRGGKPLAVIEAKATSHDVGEGRRQAILYADSLERKYGVRPVIYYTNGFETRIIDGMGYSERSVYSFHSMDDLERLIQKRDRAEIRDIRINENITNRPYQQTAIKSIIEWLNQKHRRGLLVLATGTGKTRVSISLCDILMRNNWIKNVLFLADRTALVNQAHRNYEALLPDVSMAVLSEDKDPDMQARIMFSTYQTMINYINKEDKLFSIGRFDLIIIDEAHRSVFGKYGTIFKYFDSLLIGLTATPRDEIDHSTFELLELDNGTPNFSYDYQEAVDDGYLNPYKTMQHHSQIMETGIRWDDLPEEQKRRLDEVFTYEKAIKGMGEDEEYHRDIDSDEIFKYLINTDTIDKVLKELMEKGLKVHSGEDIGKTIIFAMNHLHAEQIVKRFRELYPEKGEDYCQLIDNYVKYKDALILDFGEQEKMPQVAVSVDMLDTGIDVPSILNLVFFKRVKSKIKFEQMIGRGTRLCPGLYGDADKTEFYIFDWCNNFEFFSIHTEGADPIISKSLTERLFALRVDIAFALQTAEHQGNEADKKLHDELKEILLQQVNSLNQARIDVREKWSIVEHFRNKEVWVCLSENDVADLKGIAYLIPRSNEDEDAKRFDVLMLNLQLEQVDSSVNADMARRSVITIGRLLESKASYPLILARIDTIREIQSVHFWEAVTLDRLETVRKELRDLVHVLRETRDDRKFIINVEDTITKDDLVAHVELRSPYKQRVVDYLANHLDNPTLKKIQDFEQLTHDDITELERIFWEEVGTRDEYDELTIGKRYNGNVAAFIRVINGIDRKKALEKYSEFIKGAGLTADQELYLKSVLDYISVNGDLQLSDFTSYPLKQLRWRDVFGNQFVNLKDFVKQMHQVITMTA